MKKGIILIVLIMMLIMLSIVTAIEPIAEFKCDNTINSESGLHDLSIYEGTINYDESTPFGNGASCSFDKHTELFTGSFINMSNDYTITLFLKTTTPTNGIILANSIDSNNYDTLHFYEGYLKNRHTDFFPSYQYSIDQAPVNSTTFQNWTLVAIRIKGDGSSLANNLVVDGTTYTSGGTPSYVSGYAGLRIGGTTHVFYEGLMDEIKIYDKYLTDEELQNISQYNAVTPIIPETPIITKIIEGISDYSSGLLQNIETEKIVGYVSEGEPTLYSGELIVNGKTVKEADKQETTTSPTLSIVGIQGEKLNITKTLKTLWENIKGVLAK